ncbi:hypothetical protein D5S18_18555 [Nocardia panacis]|uniref:Uncharacterized protein n=1 Tax=Nocardia panacis TaxID=2340916 RepID=A0A3A4KID1_9NOCA|nr:hypothetical protein [Nocardia panacis]RJO74155.1 hypothetical protein D5S18_18555 [Nocardia panacis]
MMVAQNRRLTAPEIAAKYGRAKSTVQRQWKVAPDWPAPIGKRGKWLEYDEAAVEEVVKSWGGRAVHDSPADGQIDSDPSDLLTTKEIAEYTGLAYGTIRADASTGKLGNPDDIDSGGVKRWRRDTIDGVMGKRRRYRRNQ